MVCKPQTTVSKAVILVTVAKEPLNTRLSTGWGFSRAEEEGERQAVGVSGCTIPL